MTEPRSFDCRRNSSIQSDREGKTVNREDACKIVSTIDHARALSQKAAGFASFDDFSEQKIIHHETLAKANLEEGS